MGVALRCSLGRSLAAVVAIPSSSAKRFLCLLAFSLALGGCAQITVLSDQGPPTSEWKFGVLAIELAPSTQNSIAAASGLGLISTPSGTTLGYANARIVRIGDDCRVVVTTKELEAITRDPELLDLLKATHKACAA
jgi:hypothetical protein